jgi:hypothetical protein
MELVPGHTLADLIHLRVSQRPEVDQSRPDRDTVEKLLAVEPPETKASRPKKMRLNRG